MTRRAFFQYGVLLPRSPFGHVDQAIGKNTAAGNNGLIAPTRIIEKDIEEMTIDGVKMVFQNTPGTEAPAEMNTYFPQFKALLGAPRTSAAPSTTSTRCAERWFAIALEWSKKINEALYRFGQEAEVMFAVAQLAALRERPHPGSDAHAARHLRATSTTRCCTRPTRA